MSFVSVNIINKMFDCTLCLQNHRRRATSQEVWVFGMVDTSHHPGLGYMEIVQHKSAATLLTIIQAHTAPGTIVHSDEWAAYNSVQGLPNVASHGVVNHSVRLSTQQREYILSPTGGELRKS